MRWQWTFVWYRNGRPNGEAREMLLPFDGRHMAEMEIRRQNQSAVLQGYSLVVLARVDMARK